MANSGENTHRDRKHGKKTKREYYYKPEPVYADEIDDVYGEYDEYDEYEFDTLGRRRW